MSASIYEMAASVRAVRERLDQLLDESDGEVTDQIAEAEAELAAGAGSLREKAEIYCRIREDLIGDADKLATAAERLASRARARRAAADRIRDRLAAALELAGEERVKTDTHTVYWQTTQAVEILVPADQIPDQWVRVAREPNKAEIARALKAGKRFDFAALQERRGLRIK